MRNPGVRAGHQGFSDTEGQSSDMSIVIKDTKTGKEFMIKGHGLDFEIFQRSKGKVVDGVKKGEGNWVSARNYPTTLPAAVYKCIHLCLANDDENNNQAVEVEADKARIKLGKILKDRVDQIVAEVSND